MTYYSPKNEYFLSIVIPIYNVECYLKHCLDSAVIKSNKIKYILVNDGSCDRSGKIAQEYAKLYKNVVYISESNQGLSVARNTGLKYAEGDWVYFLDSDDFLDTDFIYKLSLIICKYKKDTLFSLPVVKKSTNNYRTLQDYAGSIDIDAYIKALIMGKRQFGVWSYVFNLNIIKEEKLYFERGKLFEDQYFIPRYLKFVNRIYQISSSEIGFYHYRFRDNSISNKKLNYHTIIEKYNAEINRDDGLRQLKLQDSTLNLVDENRLTVIFRAYIDLLKINDMKEAKKKKREFLKVKCCGCSVSSIKIRIKILLIFLPSGICRFFIRILSR